MNDEDFQRIPIIIAFSENAVMTETYGFVGSTGKIFLEGQLLRPSASSDTLFIMMHPSSTLQLLPIPAAMAAAGMHVLCAASRYAKNDSALIWEKTICDLGAYVRHAREVLRYRHVVLLGWSGGGSLALAYQAQAEEPTITHTPAGDPYDLTRAGLQGADGVIFIAAHLSRAELLTQWLDPSVVREDAPDERDLEFDIYDPDCPFKAPFPTEYLRRFRQAQIDRNRRITEAATQFLERQKAKRSAESERAFVVHRTMCDPRWLDPTIEPNGRRANWCYLGEPSVVNTGPVGLARFTTCRSWLSQWSYDRSNARADLNAPMVRNVPVLQIVNGADDAVPSSHGLIVRDALGTPDKEFAEIEHATHYFLNQPEQLRICVDTIADWGARHGLLSNR